MIKAKKIILFSMNYLAINRSSLVMVFGMILMKTMAILTNLRILVTMLEKTHYGKPLTVLLIMKTI